MKPKMVEAGQPIKVGELSLTVLQELSSGKNKRTYKVKDQRGVLYIYKYTKKREIKKEVERAATLARLGLPHSKVVASGSESTRRSRGSRESRRTVERLERSAGRERDRERESSRTGYVLREWIDGVRGDDWLKSWQSFGSPDSSGVKALFSLFDKAARAGTYVGHLNPECVVYNDGQAAWYIVDCGSIVELPAKDAATRYFWKVFERWGSRLDRYPASNGMTDRVSDALAKLFDLLAPLGVDYPVSTVLVPSESELSAPLSVSSKRREADSDDDDENDDDSSGDIEDIDDDSSGSLPPDSQPDEAFNPTIRRDINQNEPGKAASFVVKESTFQDMESSDSNLRQNDPGYVGVVIPPDGGTKNGMG